MNGASRALLGVLLIGVGAPVPSHARTEPIYIHPYLTADYFLPGTAGQGLFNDANAVASYLNGIGYSVTGQMLTKPAPGLRAGFMLQFSRYFDLGFSFGYILGPKSTLEIKATAPGLTGTIKDQRGITFMRYLLEPVFSVPINDTWVFHLGTAGGIAQGKVEEKISCTGNACRNVEVTGRSSWSGLTWEVSPYVSYGQWMFGARYAAFPEFKGSSSNSKIQWRAGAVFAGARF